MAKKNLHKNKKKLAKKLHDQKRHAKERVGVKYINKKGEPLTKEEWQKKWDDEQKSFDKRYEKKPLTYVHSNLSKYKTLYILSNQHIPRNAMAVKSFASKTFNLIFNMKHTSFTYVDNIRHKKCTLTDERWGNLFIALKDVSSYEWTEQNSYAKHILEIDHSNYLRMQVLCNWLLEILEKKAENFAKEQKHDILQVDKNNNIDINLKHAVSQKKLDKIDQQMEKDLNQSDDNK